jgi:hypothetical protein
LDVSKFSLSPRYVDAVGSFTLDTSSSSYDQINLVLVSADIKSNNIGYTWNADSGDWTTSENWKSSVVPPGTSKDEIVITSETADSSQINLQGDRVFAVLKTSTPGEVRLAEGAILPSGLFESPLVETTDGTLRLPDIRPNIGNEFNMQTLAGSTQIVEGVLSSPETVNINVLSGNA